MRKFVLVFFILPRFAFSQTYSLNKVKAVNENEITFVKHTFYEIGFSTKYHLPAWTFYSLTKEHLLIANLERKGSFVKDPELNSLQAKSADYSASGFDKGHMVPCEDMSFSEQAMHETFYYSNCAPQTTELNRGEWKVLEELCREWAKEYGELIVLSGPVFEMNLKTIGEDRIPIPNLFYKIILRHKAQTYKAISFLMPNSATTLNALPNYFCSIDSLEKLTQLDFFSDLPDNLEAEFESGKNLKEWNFEYHRHTQQPNDTIVKTNSHVSKCKAVTKKGKRCLNKTSNDSGLCRQHQKD
jgi:endonuclease G